MEKRIEDWPCRRCGAEDLTRREVGNGDFEDYRYTCNICGHSWVEEGADA